MGQFSRPFSQTSRAYRTWLEEECFFRQKHVTSEDRRKKGDIFHENNMYCHEVCGGASSSYKNGRISRDTEIEEGSYFDENHVFLSKRKRVLL